MVEDMKEKYAKNIVIRKKNDEQLCVEILKINLFLNMGAPSGHPIHLKKLML